MSDNTGPGKGALDFSGFPKLKIQSSNVAGSWKRFCRRFELQVEIKRREMGTKLADQNQVDIFDNDSKLLALLSSIGEDGDDVLTAVGLSWGDGKITYQGAMDVLKAHFAREDSVFVRTQKYVMVSQNVGEDQRDYLKRVERLSRDLEFFNDTDGGKHEALQNARASLTLTLAVNGLRDRPLCKELMSKPNLTWTKLNDILQSRSVAVESNDIIGVSSEPLVKQVIKPEPWEVHSLGQGYDQGSQNFSCCYSCGEWGHIAKFCPKTLCFKCHEYGHTASTCPTAQP